jgi:hypothetical protein
MANNPDQEIIIAFAILLSPLEPFDPLAVNASYRKEYEKVRVDQQSRAWIQPRKLHAVHRGAKS